MSTANREEDKGMVEMANGTEAEQIPNGKDSTSAKSGGAKELSAAEKAELRRQKILAKRQARMALVTGDRNISTQFSTPVAAPSSNTPAEANDSSSPAPRPADNASENTMDTPLLEAVEQPDEGKRRRLSDSQKALFRGALLAIAAMTFCFTHLRQRALPYDASALEVFVGIEAALLLPAVVAASAQMRNRNDSGGFLMSAMRIARGLMQCTRMVWQVYADGAVYMLVLMLCYRGAQRLGYG